MRSEEQYTGPYANVETYDLTREPEAAQLPWSSLVTPARPSPPSPAAVPPSLYKTLVGGQVGASSLQYRQRWLTRTASPLAREAVLAAYDYAVRSGAPVSWIPDDKDYLDTGFQTDDTLAYRNWVRRKLQTSGLAERLPSGLSELPDIYLELPAAWAALERLGRPRNYRQLIGHVARHLDWYLDPAQPVKPSVWVVGCLPSLLLAGLSGFLLIAAPGLANSFPGLFYSLPFAAFVLGIVLTGLVVERHVAFGTPLRNFRGWQRIVNAAELYYYLREEYSPTPADPASAEL